MGYILISFWMWSDKGIRKFCLNRPQFEIISVVATVMTPVFLFLLHILTYSNTTFF